MHGGSKVAVPFCNLVGSIMSALVELPDILKAGIDNFPLGGSYIVVDASESDDAIREVINDISGREIPPSRGCPTEPGENKNIFLPCSIRSVEKGSAANVCVAHECKGNMDVAVENRAEVFWKGKLAPAARLSNT